MEQQYPPFAYLYPCGVRRYDVRVRLIHNFDIFNYTQRGLQKQIWKMIFVDNQGDGLQCTIFSPHVDRFIGKFQIGCCYVLQFVQIVPADYRNDMVSSFKQMLLTGETYVIPEEEDDVTIPRFYYDLVPLSHVGSYVTGTDRLIDVIGLVLYVSPIEHTPNNFIKREVAIMDKTWEICRLTVWNEYVHAFDNVSLSDDKCEVVVACGLHVKEYYGAYLTTGHYSRIYFNPDNRHTTSLTTWYGSEKVALKRVTAVRASTFKLHSTIAVYNALRTKISSFSQKRNVQYCRLVAETRRFHTPTDNIIYEACSRCYRRVISFDGVHKCLHCKMDKVYTVPRLLLRLIIFDETGELRVTLMHDLAQFVLRTSATEIKSKLQQPDGSKIVFNKLMKVFGLKAYSWILPPPRGAFNPNQFYTVDYLFEVDWADECSGLFKTIKN